jgi:hypothetical protein
LALGENFVQTLSFDSKTGAGPLSHLLRDLQPFLAHNRKDTTGAVPSGLGSFFGWLTQDLRPGLTYAAPAGLWCDGAFCALRPSICGALCQGLKPASTCEAYAALKRRSSTVVHAFRHD